MVSGRKSGAKKAKATEEDTAAQDTAQESQDITQDTTRVTTQDTAQDHIVSNEDAILSSDEQMAVKALQGSRVTVAHSVEGESQAEQVYSYRSTPKSAESRLASLQVSWPSPALCVHT